VFKILKGIKPIRTILSQQLAHAEDKYEIQQLTNCLKWLNRVDRSYTTYELYKELKNSEERVIIYDRETQEAKVATNAELFKLAAMKEDLVHEQQLHEDANCGIGTSSLGDQADIKDRLRAEACGRTILGEIIANRLP